eukprot:scaffold64255_cov46-Phaeocystis_antarctica.AAC.1
MDVLLPLLLLLLRMRPPPPRARPYAAWASASGERMVNGGTGRRGNGRRVDGSVGTWHESVRPCGQFQVCRHWPRINIPPVAAARLAAH